METATVARRPLPRVALVLLSLFLALGLSLSSAHTAAAFDPGPVAKLVPGVTRVASKSAVSRLFCIGGPVICGAVTLGTLAYAAFSTKDQWMPLLRTGVPAGTTGAYTLPPTSTWDGYIPLALGRSAPIPGGTDVPITVTQTGNTLADVDIYWQCRGAGGGTSNGHQHVGQVTNSVIAGGISQVMCETGQDVTYTRVRVKHYANASPIYSDWAWASIDADAPAPMTRAEVQCSDGSQTVTITSDGSNGEVIVPSCVERLGPGWYPEKWGVGAGLDADTLIDIIREEISPDVAVDYPACAGEGCPLEIRLDGSPCQVGQEGCVDWARGLLIAPERYACYWGPYSMPFSECNILERAYTDTVDPITGTGNGIVVIRDPSDLDGEPTTVPQQPGTDAPPTVSIPPITDWPGAAGAPDVNADADTHACWPSGWGMLNPVQWVLQPIRCAFIPSEGLQPRVDRVGQIFADSPAGTFADSLFGAGSPWGTPIGSGACPDWHITVAGSTRPILCGTAYSDSMLAARPWLAAGAIAAAFAPLARGFVRGAMPIIKPTGGT